MGGDKDRDGDKEGPAAAGGAQPARRVDNIGPYSKEAPGKWTRFPVRARPHRNPLSDDLEEHPVSPDVVPWPEFYPGCEGRLDRPVDVVDIGCAFGGLLCGLAPIFPELNFLGMEIRQKVVDFAQGRIRKLREGTEVDGEKSDHHFNNVWVIQNNAMKYFPNYIRKGQLSKLFFCFQDPHFKKRNFRRRIVGPALAPEWAYGVKVGGLVYVITDVEELYDWMYKYLDESSCFKVVDKSTLESDPCIPLIQSASEDAQRTLKKGLSMYWSVFERLSDD